MPAFSTTHGNNFVKGNRMKCEEASSKVLDFLSTLFGETREHPLHIVQNEPNPKLDATVKFQCESHSFGQQVTSKRLELETLRLAILEKQKEIRDLEAAKLSSVEKTNSLLISTEGIRLPSLPINVIFQIFRYLHMTAEFNERSPLFKTAEGFADLRSWQRAILRIVPVVLTTSPAAWNKATYIMTDTQLKCVGRAPRLCQFRDEYAIDRLASNEPAMLVLADEDTFNSDILTGRNFDWQSVVLLAATVPRLRYMLHACGESLWRARSLSIGLKYSTGAQAKFSAGDLEPRGGFQLWLPDKAEIRSELRRLSLPLDIISDITPLLPRLQSIEILVSIHSHSQILIHLLQKLQRLPRALTSLSLTNEDSSSLQLFQALIGVVHRGRVSLPLLQALRIRGFDDFCTNAFLGVFSCPNLSSLTVEPSNPTDNANPSHPAHNSSWLVAQEADKDFPSVLQKNFPTLRSLRYIPASMNCLPFLKALVSNSSNTESKWMLPRIEVLDLCTLSSTSTLGLIRDFVRLSTDRLNDPEVANLRSITVSIFTRAVSDLSSDKHERKTEQVWNGCWLNALRILVPEVKFITATTEKADFCPDELPHHPQNFHHTPSYHAYRSTFNAAVFVNQEYYDDGF